MVGLGTTDQTQKLRLIRILCKHVELADEKLTDRAFVEAVVERFRKYQEHHLVDVNE